MGEKKIVSYTPWISGYRPFCPPPPPLKMLEILPLIFYSIKIGIFVIAACSHMRSWKYFLESVASAKKFLAVPCPDYPSFKAGLCGDCDKTKSNCSMALPMGFWTPPTWVFSSLLNKNGGENNKRMPQTNIRIFILVEAEG